MQRIYKFVVLFVLTLGISAWVSGAPAETGPRVPATKPFAPEAHATAVYNLLASTRATSDNITPQRILVYSTRARGSALRATDFDTDLPATLALDGHKVTVFDRASVPTLTSALLARYDQLWFISTETDAVLSSDEVQAIQGFHNAGKGIMVIGDGCAYTAPANQFSPGFGVCFTGKRCCDCNHCGRSVGCFVSTAGFPRDDIWNGVSRVQANLNEGDLSVVSTGRIMASHNNINMVALSTGPGGRVAWDATVYRFSDASANPYCAITFADNARYVRNLAIALSMIGGGSGPGGEGPAEFVDRLGKDLQAVAFRAQSGTVTMQIPTSIAGGSDLHRLIDAWSGWNHKTLWVDERRTEAYEQAFLEIVMQQGQDSAFADVEEMATKSADALSGLSDVVSLFTTVMYRKYGTLTGVAYIRATESGAQGINTLKHGARDWQAFTELKSFKTVMLGLSLLDESATLADVMAETYALMTALEHDLARERLGEIESALGSQRGVLPSDPAVWKGLKQAKEELDLLADRNAAGAFIASLQDHKEQLVRGIPDLAAALLVAGSAAGTTGAAIASHPVFITFMLTYDAVCQAVEEEKEIHLASALGTAYEWLGTSTEQSQVAGQARTYAQCSFYRHMGHAMTSTWGGQLLTWTHPLIHTAYGDWVAYYAARASETCAMVGTPRSALKTGN